MKKFITASSIAVLAASGAWAAVTLADLDITGDNFVTYEEAKNTIPRLDKSAFKELDLNSDNRLSSTELSEGKAQTILSQHDLLTAKERPLFLIDADGDGFMSMEDMQRAYPKFTLSMFKEIDGNGDNRLSYEEYYSPTAQTRLAQCVEPSFVDLASIDANSDKFADFNEIQAMYPGMDMTNFKAIDLNGDNRVSAIEFLMPKAQCVLAEHGS